MADKKVAMYGREFTVYELLKELPKGLLNSFYIDVPTAGPSLAVFEAVSKVFLEAGFAFSGSVQEMVNMAVEAGRSEREIREGFQLLADRDHVQLEGDKFIPQPKWLDHLY